MTEINELQDLEGRLDNSTPVGSPRLFATHLALPSLELEVVNERRGGYRTYRVGGKADYGVRPIEYTTEMLESIDEESLSETAIDNIRMRLEHEIRTAWDTPEEVNAFNRSPYRLVSYDPDHGIYVAVAVQYYKRK